MAVVGATGVVGEQMLRCLEARDFPVKSLLPLASARSAGRSVRFRGADLPIQVLEDGAFPRCDIALFSAGGSASRHFAPQAAAAGAVVIDNSSAWREDPEVPLVVPEVNAATMRERSKGIIANPNCSTIQLVVALAPLHAHFHLEHVVVSTYQAVSGAGRKGLDALEASRTRHVNEGVAGVDADLRIDWTLDEATGYTEEELKVMRETRRILGAPSLNVTVSTVRVPVAVGHSESVWLRAKRPITAAAATDILSQSPGLAVVAHPDYPRPLAAAGQDPVFVGRIRDDLHQPGTLQLWVVADNLLKGAALNAVQIAERLARV